MAVQQKLVLKVPEGSTYVNLNDWAKLTLPEEEYPLFEAAQTRQTAFVNAKAVSVDFEAGTNTFANESDMESCSGGDPDFLNYWYRYLVDTGITVEQSVETV